MPFRLRAILDDPRTRFVLVGGINTAVGYGLFVLAQLTIGRFVGYLVSLYVSYAIAIVIAFFLHRRFSFRVVGTGRVIVDFLRFQVVYLVALAINTVALPLLVEGLDWSPYFAQAIVVVVTTIVSYLGHRWFSFRRPRALETGSDSADSEAGANQAPR